MVLTIHQKRFSSLKTNLISFFTNGANRPGVNRPLRKMVLERIVPGGTGFGANRPVTSFLDTKFRGNRLMVPEKIFEGFLPYMGVAAILVR